MVLGRLEGMASILPDTGLFLYMYVRKEALLSSQIESTQSSLSNFLLFESEEAVRVALTSGLLRRQVADDLAGRLFDLEQMGERAA